MVKAADRDLHSGLYRRRRGQPDPHPGQDPGRPARRDRPRHHSRLLRRRRGDACADTEGILGDARRDGRDLPRRGRPVDPVRRKGPLGAGTDLGAADGRGQRHHRRLYRRGLQDGDRRRRPRPRCRSASSASRTPRRSARPSAPSSRRACRPTARSSSTPHGGSPAIQLPYDSPFLTKAKTALSDEWPKPAVMIGMGGSIPIVGDFQTDARHGIAAGRLRPRRRPHPFAEREIRAELLPQGPALLGAHSRRADALSGEKAALSAEKPTFC